jgi:hypothetical protein
MATRRRDGTSGYTAPNVSGFTGQPLHQVGGLEDDLRKALSELGIHDAEQLVGLANVEGARNLLAEDLDVSNQDLDRLVQDAKRVVPSVILQDIDEPVPLLFGFGAVEPTPPMKARADQLVPASGADVANLPSSVSLVSQMSDIRNQAHRSTCVAFTATAINEYIQRLQGTEVDLSEQHLYYECKVLDGNDQPGTWIATAAQVLAGEGECLESTWAYNPGGPDTRQGPPPPNAAAEALNYRLQLEQLPRNSVITIKARLADRRPVGISFPVYSSWAQSPETWRTGRITMRLGNEPPIGGHAVCLVGYQDDSSSPGGGYFILRNHWSTAWAAQSPYGAGYGIIPYQYITNDCWEAFASPEAPDQPSPPGPDDGGTWQVLFSAQLAAGGSHRWYSEQWSASRQVKFRLTPKPPADSSSVDFQQERFTEADGSITYFFTVTNRSQSTVQFDVEYKGG